MDIITNNDNIEQGKNIKNKLYSTLDNKIIYFQNIIKKTILSCQKYKRMDIISSSELCLCITTLERLFSETMKLYTPIIEKHKIDIDSFTCKLQIINDELANIFKSYGTESFDDLIKICFGNEYINKYIKSKSNISDKYDVLINYFHPITYKVFNWKNDKLLDNSSNEKNSDKNKNEEKQKSKKVIQKNKIVEDFMIVDLSENMECFDLARTSKLFQTKVYGIKIALQHPEHKKTIIVSGIVDDILIECINNTYIEGKMNNLIKHKPTDDYFNNKSFDKFILSLTLKELLVYNNDELYSKYMGYINQINLIKQKPVSSIVNEFINNDLYSQRKIIIELLLKSNDHEFQYLSYLLYDLLSTNDSNGNIDTQEQTLLYDSLPWNVKKFFKDAMKQTIQYTNNLSNFDNNKIPFEQQICLIKANDNVKEKAMIKLKEIKAKNEDSGSKARQYLEGLLKIPFGVYKQEEILNIMNETKTIFTELILSLNNQLFLNKIPLKLKTEYTSIEINKYTKLLKNTYSNELTFNILDSIKNNLNDNNYYSRTQLIDFIIEINSINKKYKIKNNKICHSGKNINYMNESLIKYISFLEMHKLNESSKNEQNINVDLNNKNKLNDNNSFDVLTNNKYKKNKKIKNVNNNNNNNNRSGPEVRA